jgi:hypothetical protein
VVTSDRCTKENVTVVKLCQMGQSPSDNLIPGSAGGDESKLVGGGGEAQRTQFQPFSLRFKNIV